MRCLALAAIAGLAAPTAAPAGGSPAFPVPECRHQVSGDEVACDDPDAVRLWPEDLRPGLPGQQLPPERDSTGWNGLTLPGAATGFELFQSLDVEGDHLFVAYNAGFQVWDVSDPHAEDPVRRAAMDGWNGDFLSFPVFGEVVYVTNDVAAVAPGRGSEVLVAVSAIAPAGVSIWGFTPPATLVPLYQDLGGGSRQIRALDFGGAVYAFAAGPGGISVYDLTAATGLASPCLDDAGSVCPGVYLGEVGATTSGRYLDVLERGGKIYVAASDGATGGLGLEIWELADPASPGGATLKFSGLDADTHGVALFPYGGAFYLAAVERVIDREIRIFDAGDCLDADGCAGLDPPLAAITPRQAGFEQTLTFSTGAGHPFLYFGVATVLGGNRVELLLDLADLGAGNQITEITDGGGTYPDPSTAAQVDYWGDYYVGNTHGLDNFQPMTGRFNGDYFYRAAHGILDVHVLTLGAIFADGFESGDVSAWSPD